MHTDKGKVHIDNGAVTFCGIWTSKLNPDPRYNHRVYNNNIQLTAQGSCATCKTCIKIAKKENLYD